MLSILLLRVWNMEVYIIVMYQIERDWIIGILMVNPENHFSKMLLLLQPSIRILCL